MCCDLLSIVQSTLVIKRSLLAHWGQNPEQNATSDAWFETLGIRMFNVLDRVNFTLTYSVDFELIYDTPKFSPRGELLDVICKYCGENCPRCFESSLDYARKWTRLVDLLCICYIKYWHRWPLLLACLSNYTHHKVWHDITYPFPNFIGAAIEVWK